MDLKTLMQTPVGTKLTLTCKSFAGPYELKGTLEGEVKQHGFLTRGGAWSLYGGHEGDEPCYVVPFKPFRKRKVVGYKIGYSVIAYRLGWETKHVLH